MKQSLRAKRLKRYHKRHSQTIRLSLVSLMDIFTILVFFLMVNASEVQVMQNNKELDLPESVSETSAAENLIITVTAEYILVQGRSIIAMDELKALASNNIEPLAEELAYQLKKRGELTETELANGLGVNIMADKAISYAVLKKIMHTASTSGFNNIALAVSQIPGASDQQVRANLAAESSGENG